MNVLKAVRYKLVNDASVAALVSAKVYPGIAPQEAQVPFVILSIVDVNPYDTKSGVSDVDSFRVQVDCYASTYDGVQDLDKKVRTAIDKYMGDANGITIDGVRYLTSQDLYEETPNEYRRTSDYTVRIK